MHVAVMFELDAGGVAGVSVSKRALFEFSTSLAQADARIFYQQTMTQVKTWKHPR